MAIIFEDVYNGVSGSWNLQGGKSYTVEVRAYSDTPVGPEAVLTATGLQIGDTYRWPLVDTATETHSYLFLQSITCNPADDDGKTYMLSIQYSPYDPAQDGVEDGVRNPFTQPPAVSFGGENEEHAAMYSRNGNPVLNTAGDPFTGVTFLSNITTFAVTRNEPSFPLAMIDALKNHLNSAEWLGLPAESVLCTNITGSRSYDAELNIYVWECSYEFAYKKPIVFGSGEDEVEIIPGWATTVLNAGLREKDGTARRQIIIDNAPTSDPVPLDDDGKQLPPDGEPVYLSFDVYPLADFSVLGFGPDILGGS